MPGIDGLFAHIRFRFGIRESGELGARFQTGLTNSLRSSSRDLKTSACRARTFVLSEHLRSG
jgi:hypothetical protein